MNKASNPLAVVILAAGKGTRMKSDLPKVMHKLAGLPMINWLLATVETLDPQRIITVIGPEMPDLEAAVKPHKTVIQQTRNGTGGALKCALPALEGFDGDVLVLLGDTPLISRQSIDALIAAKKGDSLSVLGMEQADPTGYGRLIAAPDGTLHKIVEEKDADAQERKVTQVNTGAFCLPVAPLAKWLDQVNNDNAAGEFYITDLPAIAAQQNIKTHIAFARDAEEVRGCNTRSDLASLEARAQQILRKKAMDSGVHMIDPLTVYLQHDTVIESGVTLEPNIFCGSAVTIKQGATIKAFCHFEGATIGENTTVGPFARLRPGSNLQQNVKIGNFVEVKKSTIGARSKINHLAYVGDCTMGADVNFSAGAITVNYDGYNKAQTIIGDNAMIGSNANLIAPITVSEGAFVAAGSTLSDDVPADALVINREPARTIAGWAAEHRKRNAKAD